MGQDIFGDRAVCPSEWSKKSAILTAKSMLTRYSPDRARKKALRFRHEYLSSGGGNVNPWALKHWDYVVDYLSDKD